jgi:hypothetical protein
LPHRLNEFRAKIQFVTSAETPSLVHRACELTGTPSNTVYIQRAVAEALARDLDIPLERLLERLPEPKGAAQCLFGDNRRPVKTASEVR